MSNKERCDECREWTYERTNVFGIPEGSCPVFPSRRDGCDPICDRFAPKYTQNQSALPIPNEANRLNPQITKE